MKYQKLRKSRLTLEDEKLIAYIENTRGINQGVASSFLLKFDLLLTPQGVPHGRWYSFVGLDNTSVVNSYYEKLHTITIDKDNIMPLVIGNFSSTTCFFFESQWDFLAFLTLVDVDMDWTMLVAKFKFMIFSNTTKNALTVAKSSNKIEKVMMLHRNKRFLNNAKKIFGDIVHDKSDNYINDFGSLSNKVRGIMI